jgi:hypothetical protein
MIDFKYYVVAIVAVLAALVVGLFMGISMSTSETVKHQQEAIIKSIKNDLARLSSVIEAKDREIASLRSYHKEVQPWLIHGNLNGITVAIIYAKNPEEGPDLNSVKKTLELAGGKFYEIILSEEATESTIVSSTIQKLLDPAVSPSNFSKDVIIKGNLTQAQEILLLVDRRLLNLIKADTQITKLPPLRLLTVNLENGREALKSAPSGSTVVVYDGDDYDPEALILSFKVQNGIYGEDEKGARILPERK